MSWYRAVLTLNLREHNEATIAADMAPQTITDYGNFTLDTKQHDLCASLLFNSNWRLLSIVQEWLDTRNASAESHVFRMWVHRFFWSADSSSSPLFVSHPLHFWMGFVHNSLLFVCLLLVHFFSTTSFLPFYSLLMFLDTELCEQPAAFNTFWVLPSLCSVNGHLLDNYQFWLPHDWVAYRTRLRDRLKTFAGVMGWSAD